MTARPTVGRWMGGSSTGGDAISGPVVPIELECGWLDTEIDGARVRLRAYNGQVPGPLMEIERGSRLEITLRNRLPPYDSSAWAGDHNVPHELNTTNLHLHGLQIIPHILEPVGTSDPKAPMMAIAPAESFTYLLDVPDNQPPGLYWYHPHHHGSTAVQAVSGMAGGIVVRGPIDDVPEIAAARDELLVVNDIGLFPSQDDPELWLYDPQQNAIWNTLSSEVLLDGQPDPSLPGGFSTGDYKLRYYLVNGEAVFKEEHNYDSGQGADPIPTQLDNTPVYRLGPGEVVRFSAAQRMLRPAHAHPRGRSRSAPHCP